jgi:hypothetical protein
MILFKNVTDVPETGKKPTLGINHLLIMCVKIMPCKEKELKYAWRF